MRPLFRVLALVLLAWAAGFLWFATVLPQAAEPAHSDAVVVLTGGKGRIERGLEALARGWAPVMYVSGVDPGVKPHEFAVRYRISSETMVCCVVLDFKATDTVSNAAMTERWIAARGVHSVRLVTSDWHMRRAAFELRRRAPKDLVVVADAVPTHPSLRILFLEYSKLLARRIAALLGG